MSLLRLPIVFARRAQSASLWLMVASLPLSLGLPAAWGQASQPTAPASEAAAPVKPPENSGLLGEIGKLLSAPAALLPSLQPANPAATPGPEPAPAPATAAPIPAPAEAVAKDPPAGSRILPGIVSGRELCPRSENGAPDCKAGSDRLCRSKGYTEGKSLDTDATFGCSTKPLPTRGKPCGTENYVIRAFCQ